MPMSNPIDPTPESVESAAQYRVSAQELSHVVSILQARKEAEARQRANTVALGEAVEQLGLDMTPDELLAEIQSDRARRSGGSRPNRQNNAQRHTFATFAICAGLAGMMVCSIHAHRLNRAMWENRHSPFSAYSISPADRIPMTETTPDIAPPVVEVTTTAPFRPFAQFEDNERADCDFQSLRDLANGKSGAEVLVQPNGTGEDKLWTVVKHDGEVLVFAYATLDETAKAMNGHAAHVYASEQEGTQEQLLPLRLLQNAELMDIPGQSGANLNAHDTVGDVKPTDRAYRAVTVELPKERFPSESLPSTRVWRGYSPDSERAK